MGDEVEVIEAQAAPGVYDAFQTALVADHGWAWSWFCNIAVPLMDRLGISHHDANVAAAHLFQHLFKIDVTSWKEYQDIISNPDSKQNGTHSVLKETSVGVQEIDENAIYINVTGFKENSGAEYTARGLAELLKLNGHRAILNIADTVLTDEQRSTVDPKPNTLFVVTGVESRYHTDRVGALEVDAAADQIVEAYAADRPVLDEELSEAEDTDTPDDCDPGDSGEGPDGDPACGCECGVAVAYEDDGRPWREGKTKIDLVLSGLDSNPLGTIQHVEDSFPKADINVRVELDQFVTDAIHAPKRKLVTFTLDPADPDPEATVAALQKFVQGFKDGLANPFAAQPGAVVSETGPHAWTSDVTATETGISMSEPVPRRLSNPVDRSNAYLLATPEGHRLTYIDNVTEFALGDYQDSDVAVESDLDLDVFREKITELLGERSDLEDIITAVYLNNTQFVSAFGGKVLAPVGVREELNFMELPQNQVPPTMWSQLERCWTVFNQPEACAVLEKELAQPGDDFRIAIPLEDYRMLTGPGGMVYRQHPQHERLFVRMVLRAAQDDADIYAWAVNHRLI